MNPTPAYRVRALSHAYDGKTVLDIPQLDIPAGEICALVGPNGSGKTTLLSILALLLRPRSGSVLLHGVESADGSDRARQRLRRQVTLIHQKPVLFSTTVRKNVSYGLRALGLPAREIDVRVGRALKEFGLNELADRRSRKLSGGEAQRVVLARGLILETPVLLLDEPTSFLDDAFRPLLFDKLRAANHSRGTTILLATHDSKLVSSLAHRVIRMEKGEVSTIETAGLPKSERPG
jgi:tungstate transport system ATP-binding protein